MNLAVHSCLHHFSPGKRQQISDLIGTQQKVWIIHLTSLILIVLRVSRVPSHPFFNLATIELILQAFYIKAECMVPVLNSEGLRY